MGLTKDKAVILWASVMIILTWIGAISVFIFFAPTIGPNEWGHVSHPEGWKAATICLGLLITGIMMSILIVALTNEEVTKEENETEDIKAAE